MTLHALALWFSVSCTALVGVACEASGEQWSFPVMRAVENAGPQSIEGYPGDGALMEGGPELFLIVLIPLAVDVVLLPITLPHDLLLMD